MSRSSPADGGPIDVALVASIELHDGVHGSLLERPPPGVRYVLPSCRHRFVVDGALTSFRPDRDPALSEQVIVPADVRLVHSSRLPVLGAAAWLVDADDVGVSWLYGRDLCFARARAEDSGTIRPPLDRVRSLQRLDAMIRCHLDPRCVAILLRSDKAMERARRMIESSRSLRHVDQDALVAKLGVLRPAVAPRWRAEDVGAVRILVVDSHPEVKGSADALRAFEVAAAAAPEIELVWVGPAPPAWPASAIEHHDWLPRAAFLDLLRTADVLLAPTRHESFGMVLLEAAAAGLAIISTGGEAVIVAHELLVDGVSAVLAPPGLPARDRGRWFGERLALITVDAALRARLGHEARELVLSGPCSFAVRDARLRACYDRMAEIASVSSPDAPGPLGRGLGRVEIPEGWLVAQQRDVLRGGHTNVSVQPPETSW